MADQSRPQLPLEPPVLDEVQRLYLDLLKGTLTRFVTAGEARAWSPGRYQKLVESALTGLQVLFGVKGFRTVRATPFDPDLRREGRDWPLEAETMIGILRLENLEAIVADVIHRDVPGDLVETGVWRGGAAIFMKGILRALGDRSRCVWACDSFQGLPKPDAARHPADAGDQHWTHSVLAVSESDVRANFQRYGLLDERVRFLPGWFEHSLPRAPIGTISVLRLDGDMYSSTKDALSALYPRISSGGYVVVDDYGAIPACRQAVDDYRNEHRITETIYTIDWTGVYWRRGS